MPRPKKGCEQETIQRYYDILDFYEWPHNLEETAKEFRLSVKTIRGILYYLEMGSDERPMDPDTIVGRKWAAEWIRVTACWLDGRLCDI